MAVWNAGLGIWLASRAMAAPALCSWAAMGRWLSAMVRSRVGTPRAQRSHEVLPAAPMAHVAWVMSSAMLGALAMTWLG